MSINIQYPKQFNKEYKDFIIVLSKLSELKNIKNLPFDASLLSSSKEFEDTNKLFETPSRIDTQIDQFMNDDQIKELAKKIINV